jgi:CubicO group peptidase (beta-lactamase class C family)
MKELDTLKTLNMCEEASDNTFGHLGFTGTVTFADPDRGLIYVFLSNRTFPSMDNKTFNRLDIRPRIQSKIYESMGIHKERA